MMSITSIRARHGWPAISAAVALWAAIVCYIVVFSALSIARHDSLNTRAFDVGIFDQVIWNTSRGRLFQNTVMQFAPNFLGNHFSPILLLLAPIYWVYADVRALLVVQTLALGLGALPIYQVARQQLGSRRLALAFAGGYLANPALQYANLWEFHETALAVPFLAFAVKFLVSQKHKLFLAFLLLALLSNESMSLVAIGMGLYLVTAQRQRGLGIAVCLGGMLWAYVVGFLIVPYFSTAHTNIFLGRFSYLGDSWQEAIRTFFIAPHRVIAELISWTKLKYVLKLLAPFGFMPTIAPQALLVPFPFLASLLISDYPPHFDIVYHYSVPMIPLLSLAAIAGVAKIIQGQEALGKRLVYALAAFVVLSGFVTSYLYGPSPLSRNYESEQFRRTSHSTLLGKFLAAIPSDASVSAQENLVPHLSQRKRVYRFPMLGGADYVFLDWGGPNEYRQQRYDGYRLGRYEDELEAQELVRNPLYESIMEEDGYRLFRRKSSMAMQHEIGTDFEAALTLLGYDLQNIVVGDGETLEVGLYWQRPEDLPKWRRDTRLSTSLALVDDKGGVAAQVQRSPGFEGSRTDWWLPGEVVYQLYSITVPLGTPPGGYRLAVGVYERAYDCDPALPVTTSRRCSRALDGAAAVVRTLSPLAGDNELGGSFTIGAVSVSVAAYPGQKELLSRVEP